MNIAKWTTDLQARVIINVAVGMDLHDTLIDYEEEDGTIVKKIVLDHITLMGNGSLFRTGQTIFHMLWPELLFSSMITKFDRRYRRNKDRLREGMRGMIGVRIDA